VTPLLSLWFLGLAVVLGFGYRLVAPRIGVEGRAWALSVISLIFLWKFLSLAVYGGWFAAWAAMAVGMALLIRLTPKPNRGLVLLAAVALMVAVMMVFRYPNYTAALVGEHPVLRGLALTGWLGLSYASFRAVDMVMTARSERTKSFSPSVALAYLLYFPPMIAGPINRFAAFAKDMETAPAPLDRAQLRAVCFRLAAGTIKLVVLSRLAWYWSIPGLPADLAGVERWQAILGVYAFFGYIYFEFAGYTDLVIAVSALFGVRMPENFQFPLAAVSIQDFWNRWHISLSQWCRDHIFYPLVRMLALRVPSLPPVLGAMASIFITFLFVGTWHGDSLNWVLYGLYHGAGLSLWMGWRQGMRRFAPALQERLDASGAARMPSMVLTASFVAWGLLLTLDPDHARRVLAVALG
jgi:alginate O-acetyltransferase complex protein AlgI